VIFYEKNFLDKSELNETISNRDDDSDLGFHDFDRFWMSFLKVTVMLGGEFEATNLNYRKFWFATAFVFAFVLSAFMLYNFINGLAIDDIQVILRFVWYVNIFNNFLCSLFASNLITMT
jgi:hypothetical protein